MTVILWLFFQLGLGIADGGSVHYATITWPAVLVTDTNADGSTFTRQVVGYNVYRQQINADGSLGASVWLNPDALATGFSDCDDAGNCTPADNSYDDMTCQQGFRYQYTITAVDFGGESAPSAPIITDALPVNPNAPGNLRFATQ